MQNFDDFEHFSSKQNLKEIFQAVFDFTKSVRSAAEKAENLREIEEYGDAVPEQPAAESAASVAPGSAAPAEAPAAARDGETETFAEEEPAPPPRPPRPAPPNPPEMQRPPVRPDPPEAPPYIPPQAGRDCACPITQRELRDFYFRVQQLYFVLERNLDNGYGKDRMRGLRELCVRILRLLSARHKRCFGRPLTYHFDERMGDAARARTITNELIADSLGFLERCEGMPDPDLLIIFFLLSTISNQLPA